MGLVWDMVYSTRGEETTQAPEPEATSLNALPPDFLEWQRESRLTLMRTVAGEGERSVRSMPSHLPVFATITEDGAINLATKGIGLVPKADLLEGLTALFRAAADNRDGRPPEDTATERLEVLLKFYGDPNNFDDLRLGGLEIFEGSTNANLSRDPHVSLLFTGEAPGFRSYQVDGVVEFVRSGDPYYEFLVSARELFAQDRFHLRQRAYPHGYIVHVSSVRSKTPFPRRV